MSGTFSTPQNTRSMRRTGTPGSARRAAPNATAAHFYPTNTATGTGGGDATARRLDFDATAAPWEQPVNYKMVMPNPTMHAPTSTPPWSAMAPPFAPMMPSHGTGAPVAMRKASVSPAMERAASRLTGPPTRVASLSLHYEPPTEKCELRPYAMLADSAGSMSGVGGHLNLSSRIEDSETSSPALLPADTPETLDAPVYSQDGLLTYRWYRSAQRRLCAAPKCNKAGHIQCLTSAKLCLPEAQSFFCSSECFARAWPSHRTKFSQAALANLARKRWSSDEEARGSTIFLEEAEHTVTSEQAAQPDCRLPVVGLEMSRDSANPGAADDLFCRLPSALRSHWQLACRDRSLTPSADDVGRQLMLECAPVRPDAAAPPRARSRRGSRARRSPQNDVSYVRNGLWRRAITTSVSALPQMPPPRRMVTARDDKKPKSTFKGDARFRVMNYNVLADVYATGMQHPYTQPWCRAWVFRRQSLLREIEALACDILCLQEVQSNHYCDFWLPQLQKRGYEGVFRPKTRDGGSSDPAKSRIDGCAIFWRRERFELRHFPSYAPHPHPAHAHPHAHPHAPHPVAHVSHHHMARPVPESHELTFDACVEEVRTQLRSKGVDEDTLNRVARRLTRGNIAQVLVLVERGTGRPLAVANTHIFWDPRDPDVKLWQSVKLVQFLQKFHEQTRVPLLLCGDFNSEPNSSVYEFLSTRQVSPGHADLIKDEAGVLDTPSVGGLRHNMPLASAYARVLGEEPPFTNYTQCYRGTLDYIFYTSSKVASASLRAVSVLDIDSEEQLKKHVALPAPQHSSDHIPLVAEFEFCA